jgi:hypothetical protein
MTIVLRGSRKDSFPKDGKESCGNTRYKFPIGQKRTDVCLAIRPSRRKLAQRSAPAYVLRKTTKECQVVNTQQHDEPEHVNRLLGNPWRIRIKRKRSGSSDINLGLAYSSVREPFADVAVMNALRWVNCVIVAMSLPIRSRKLLSSETATTPNNLRFCSNCGVAAIGIANFALSFSRQGTGQSLYAPLFDVASDPYSSAA